MQKQVMGVLLAASLVFGGCDGGTPGVGGAMGGGSGTGSSAATGGAGFAGRGGGGRGGSSGAANGGVAGSAGGSAGTGGGSGASATGGSGGTGSSAGGSAGSEEVAASPEDVQTTCQALCDSKMRCRGGGGPDCVSSCVSLTPMPSRVSRQALDILLACYADPACLSDNTCDARVLARDPSIRPVVERCVDFTMGCSIAIDQSRCLRLGLLLPAARAKLDSCLSQPCGDGGAALCLAN